MVEVPTASDVDLFDPGVLAAPWEVHGGLREAGPVVRLRRHDAWITGRDELVREVLVDPVRFSSAAGVGLQDIRRAGSWQPPSKILEVDPPEHGVVRRVLNRVLSPRKLRALRDEFRRVADDLVDECIERGEFDAVADLALRFPFTVLPDAVGMRADGREHLLRYSRMYFDARAPGTELARRSAADADAAGSLPWVRDQCRREHLATGGIGREIFDAVDTGEIDDDTAAGLVRSFLGGGIDTTVLALGTLLVELAGDPAAWASLRADPSLIRSGFDEALRLAPPAAVVVRTTTGAVTLGGVELGPGEKVICSLVGAGRDPRRWERPDEFDLRRAGGQLGFGLGPHFCVGHSIARLEADCLLGALAERVATIEPAGEPTPFLNNWLLGPASFPVRVIAADGPGSAADR